MTANAPIDFDWLHDGAALADPSGPPGLLVLALLAGAMAGLAALLVGRLRRDRERHGPAVRRLARGLGLSGRERRLLERVARVAGRPHAGSLLLSRGCFDAAMRGYAARYGAEPQLVAIRRTIFD